MMFFRMELTLSDAPWSTFFAADEREADAYFNIPSSSIRSQCQLPQNPTIRTLSNNSPGAATGLGTISTDTSPGLLSTSAFTLEVTPGMICDSSDTGVERPLCSGPSRQCLVDCPSPC